MRERGIPDPEVETVLSGKLHKVLVGADAGGFEGLWRICQRKTGGRNCDRCDLETDLGGQLFILVGNEMDAQREVIDGGTLASEIEDLNLGVGNTTVEPRLRVRLVWMSQQVSFFLALLSFSFAERERGGMGREGAHSCSSDSTGRDDGP